MKRRKISAARRGRAERVHLRDCPIRRGCDVWGGLPLSCAQCEEFDRREQSSSALEASHGHA